MLGEDERASLRATVRTLLDRHCSEDDVRRVMAGEHGVDEELAARLAEVGVPLALVPEELGGAGATLADLAGVMEEAGRSLACVPLLSAVHAIAVLDRVHRRCPSPVVADLLGAVAEDRARVAVVDDVPRPGARTAIAVGSGWQLHGAARYVLDGHRATHLLVPAECGSDRRLFLVDAGDPAVRRRQVGTLDQTRRLAQVTFAHAPVTLLADIDDAGPVLGEGRDVAVAALAAECVGGADAVLEMTTAYARTRVQFGRPIGSFQAVKHHCAEMLLELELARSAADHAAAVLADPAATRTDRQRAVLLAQVQGTGAYYRCASLALQVHGGIGFTWEHPLHLYLKRAKSAQHLYGDAAAARVRLAASLGLDVPA